MFILFKSVQIRKFKVALCIDSQAFTIMNIKV